MAFLGTHDISLSMVAHRLKVVEDGGKRLNSKEPFANGAENRFHSALNMGLDLWSETLFPRRGNILWISEPIVCGGRGKYSSHSLDSILLGTSPTLLGLAGQVLEDAIKVKINLLKFNSKARENVTECGL